MAPREASNVFPDQYLTIDYDTSSPPTLNHDQAPVTVGENGNIGGETGHDLGNFELHVNQVMNNMDATNDNGGQVAGNDLSGNSENGGLQNQSNSGGIIGSTSQSVDNEDENSGQNGNMMIHPPVDPLSIDPTNEGDNPLAMPSVSMKYVESVHPHAAPVVSPSSTHVAPWSGSLKNASPTPSFPTPQQYYGDYIGSDGVGLHGRVNPVAVSPVPGSNFAGSRYRGSESVEGFETPSYRSVRNSQGQNLNSLLLQGVGSSPFFGQLPVSSQSQIEDGDQDHDQNCVKMEAPSLPRRRLRRIVTNSPLEASPSNSNQGLSNDFADLLSLPGGNRNMNMDLTQSSHPLHLHKNAESQSSTTLSSVSPVGIIQTPSPSFHYVSQMMNQSLNSSHHNETCGGSHDVESVDSSPDSTPTRNLDQAMHHLFRSDAFHQSSSISSSTVSSHSHSHSNSHNSHSHPSSTSASTTLSEYSAPGQNYSTPPRHAVSSSLLDAIPSSSTHTTSTSTTQSQLSLAFSSNTKVSDLKYFAERGCIVACLSALNTPRLKTLGCRMLADYAKMPSRRVAVASNKRILQFVIRTIHEFCEKGTDSVDWLGREYAVETVRSLTATEESDAFLMNCEGMLKTLALCARGGPFLRQPVRRSGSGDHEVLMGLASGRARLHACIAIMNLSCGKSNKVEIAKLPQVLEAMRDAMLMRNLTMSQHSSQSTIMDSKRHAEEARLKATTCIKNLSNADANDAALLKCPGLVEALGHVAALTCKSWQGSDATTTTNACLALMNLSISKANKHIVFRTRGVMDALMAVISQNEEKGDAPVNVEAKVKACSALSNLAIGYDNKIPMFSYPGFVDAILHVIETDRGEARTKACSILWSFAAEMKNQVPVVQRGDILPVLVRVADEDNQTEARFKCVAALTLLAESLENAIPLLESGALAPLMDILHEAGPDPTQWKGQTASWCVGFLMNMAQSDEAVPSLREAGVVELLAPLLTLDHYQSLKAAMAVTFVCRYDEGDETYDLLRKTETVIPKIISLLHNTLSGRGGNGYKYGVFTLRSSVGCIASLASGPDFMKERIATGPVYESLLRVLSDFCVNGGTPGAIVGGGIDDSLSPTLAVRALHELTGHLIPIPGASGSDGLPFGKLMDEKLIEALKFFAETTNNEIKESDRLLARETKNRILGRNAHAMDVEMPSAIVCFGDSKMLTDNNRQAFTKSHTAPNLGEIEIINTLSVSSSNKDFFSDNQTQCSDYDSSEEPAVRTFLLADSRGRRFAVPINPSGGRSFNDNRVWCYRRGRFCRHGERPDPNFVWTRELQRAYLVALAMQCRGNTDRSRSHRNVVSSNSF